MGGSKTRNDWYKVMQFFFWKSVGDDDDVPVFSDGGSGRGID